MVGFARGHVTWEGDHIRLLLLPRDSKGLHKDVVRQISAHLREIECRCVLEEAWKCKKTAQNVEVACVNRFSPLAVSDECVIGSSDDGELLSQNVGGNKV